MSFHEYLFFPQAKISKELKRILCKKPSDRTQDEIYYVNILMIII
jgi:hypothetical protein